MDEAVRRQDLCSGGLRLIPQSPGRSDRSGAQAGDDAGIAHWEDKASMMRLPATINSCIRGGSDHSDLMFFELGAKRGILLILDEDRAHRP